MTDPAAWHAANDRYLAAELRALRRLLAELAARSAPPPRSPPAGPAPRGGWFGSLFKRREPRAPALVAATAECAPETGDPAVPAAPEAMPALVILAERLGLNEFERRTLLLCAAMELDTAFGSLCARAMRDPSRPYPTFALALAAFPDAAWDILSPERPLRHWRLIEIVQTGPQPLIASAIRADERIVSYIKGLNYLDDRLSPLVKLVDTRPEPLPPSQAEVAEAVLAELRRVQDARTLPSVQLLGTDRAGKLAVARHVCRTLGLALHHLPADSIPQAPGDAETFARLWQREAILLPLALYLDAGDVDREDSAKSAAVRRLLKQVSGPLFVDARDLWSGSGRGSRSFDVAKPLPAEQLAAWREALAGDPPIAAELSGQFNLDLPTIRAIAAASAGGDEESRDSRLWQACLARVRPALDQLAQPIVPKADWKALELPAPEERQLRQIVAQVRNRTAVYDEWGFRERLNRGLGISVLFAGESGTGKTMAAEVIARDLDLLLYRVDLSGVVSKYIGETEKNLRKLFDSADDGGAILFFDEADALFGKRSEVKDSHDRYANIEVNYLLQRMESYRGLAILTTNMKSALDQAFLRRLRFVVNFPFPGPEQRLAIWRKAFPPRMLPLDLDFARLARLNLAGGSIHNIALAAAFSAAAARSKVTMPIVLDAARAEYRKLEKPVNEADFQWLERVGGAA